MSRFATVLGTAGLLAFGTASTDAAVLTYQQGVLPTASYSGTQDTEIEGGNNSDVNKGNNNTITAISSQNRQILVRFDDIFGGGPNQIPLGSQILSATLELTRGGGGAGIDTAVYRMLIDWDEDTATWNSLNGGVSTDGTDASATADDTWSGTLSGAQSADYDVTGTVAAWSAGAENYGWVAVNTSGTFTIKTSENTAVNDRPLLTVEYVIPEPASLGLLAAGGMMLLTGRRRRI